ncbi:MAG: hypothetical protein RMK91_05845 [Pseudanabaenaceae cyanobacterium SKYGB_i_bin29]|nr:hypothetical protein [Pseudanabaenaceae cyanobacterium SKYG29]MDW8421373.1 hypothetical protein [Pseudanabaenaceae cyanobacterium SKYGB_i_bin29]
MQGESIEDILAQLKQQPDPLDKLLAELDKPAQPETKPRNAKETTSKPDSPFQSPTDRPIPELEAVQADLQKQKAEKAKAWLKNLDRPSEDGIWFEEFAKHYSSELEAAIAFLEGKL